MIFRSSAFASHSDALDILNRRLFVDGRSGHSPSQRPTIKTRASEPRSSSELRLRLPQSCAGHPEPLALSSRPRGHSSAHSSTTSELCVCVPQQCTQEWTCDHTCNSSCVLQAGPNQPVLGAAVCFLSRLDPFAEFSSLRTVVSQNILMW